MRVVCTYCSNTKDKLDGLPPAYQRYTSARIRNVDSIAQKAELHFCILSGEYGLLDRNQPIPWYDHLLVEAEVPQLVAL